MSLNSNDIELERLESYIPILRGLIGYHKRMFLVREGCVIYDPSKGVVEGCKEKCPKTSLQDLYLGALEESLRLMEREIAEIEGDRETIRCAKHKVEWELKRVKHELAEAEAREERCKELHGDLSVAIGYVCHIAKQYGLSIR